jgi:hypothetical protein
MKSWVSSEFDGIDLGDQRLNTRAKCILDNLYATPGRTIPQNFRTWGEIKACYRFFNNSHVDESKIFTPHYSHTLQRIKQNSTILCIADTTSVNYTSKKSMNGKGSIGTNVDGLWIHPTIAVTPERLNLGLVDVNFYVRKESVKEHRNKRSIEEKETFRWINSYRRVNQLALDNPESHFVYVADREADIIELLNEALDSKINNINYADIVIRLKHNRLIDEIDQDGRRPLQIKEKLQKANSVGEISYYLPATHDRKSRQVTQILKSINVVIKPHEKSGKRKSPTTINIVMAMETLESAKNEDPLIWMILTTLPAETYTDVCLVLDYYLSRWEIEVFFKVLKSGCKVEERYLHSVDNMKSLIAFFMIISWRIMYVMMLGRNCPEISCEHIFEEAEWKSVYKILNKKCALPANPPKLQELIVMIATLGGYIPNNSAPPPGITVMWRGMCRMNDFALAWEAFGD